MKTPEAGGGGATPRRHPFWNPTAWSDQSASFKYKKEKAMGEVYCDKTLSDSEPPMKLAWMNQGRQHYQMFYIVIAAL